MAIVLAAAIAHLPLFFFDILQTADGYIHVNTAISYSHHVTITSPYPRWLVQNQNGFGSPFLFFYPPLLYAVFFAIESISFSTPDEKTIVGLSLTLFSIFQGMGLYFLSRIYLSKKFSAVVGFCGIFLPYHALVNVTVRGALPEYCALSFTPWILYAVAYERSKKNLTPSASSFTVVAVGYALTILTHLPTAIILAPLLIVFVVSMSGTLQQRIRFSFEFSATFCFALGIGAMLAAPLLVPGLMYRNNIATVWASSHPILDPSRARFLISTVLGQQVPDMKFADVIGVFWLTTCLAIFVRALYLRENLVLVSPYAITAAFALAGFLGVPFFLWEEGGPLSIVIFPMRFLHFFELFVFLCAAFYFLSSPRLRLFSWRRTCAITIACAAVITSLNFVQLFRLSQIEIPPWRAERIDAMWQANEYLPAQATREEVLDLERRVLDSKRELVSGEGVILLDADFSDGAVSFSLSSSEAVEVSVRQFWFPGWQLEDLRTGFAFESSIDPEYRTLLYEIPAGTWELELSRRMTLAEKLGWFLFCVSLVILFATRRLLGIFAAHRGRGKAGHCSNHGIGDSKRNS